MKLCKLKLKNLNSFREEIELDFRKIAVGMMPLLWQSLDLPVRGRQRCWMQSALPYTAKTPAPDG